MSSPAPFQYQSSGFSEPGIFVEIYLPKRARFQEILHNTLTKGFDFDLVKRHFLGKKRKSIKKVLSHHKQWKNYSKASIESMVPSYWGYSLYEVDGVFHSKKRRNKKLRSTIEERTQVIRMMFLPDLDLMKRELGLTRMERHTLIEIVKLFLRVSGHKRGEHGANLLEKNMTDRLLEKFVEMSITDRKLDKSNQVLLKEIKNGSVDGISDYAEELKVKRAERRDFIDIAKILLWVSLNRREVDKDSVTRSKLLDELIEKNLKDPILGREDRALLRHIKNGSVARILDYAEKWYDDVGLFLFGYVIFEICSRIKKLGDQKEVDYEEEIWLTSFWNLNVNRVKGFQPRLRRGK